MSFSETQCVLLKWDDNDVWCFNALKTMQLSITYRLCSLYSGQLGGSSFLRGGLHYYTEADWINISACISMDHTNIQDMDT